MKICATICEYNPFHNGHLYQMREAKRISGAEKVLLIMSGNFVQRGEDAILDKFTRAKHAVLAGADAVIELPVPFATANAELFAKGAMHVLSSIPDVKFLSFGAENADPSAFFKAEKLLKNEPKEISEKIREKLKTGESYARAYADAWKDEFPDGFFTSPNNVLGIEYAKANKGKLTLLPVERVGCDHGSKMATGDYASATAIRENLRLGEAEKIKNCVPDFVFPDLIYRESRLETLERLALIEKDETEIARTLDCTEGLEHALKREAKVGDGFVERLTSKRYTSSRIRRIALQNLLSIDEKLIRDCLSSPLYLRVLAVKKDDPDFLSVLKKSDFPLLVRHADEQTLDGVAKDLLSLEKHADEIYSLCRNLPKIKKDIFI